MDAFTPVMMVDMVSTVVIPGRHRPAHYDQTDADWGKILIIKMFLASQVTTANLFWTVREDCHLPSGTLAGTARRSIQKDTQDSMTIRVAGK